MVSGPLSVFGFGITYLILLYRNWHAHLYADDIILYCTAESVELAVKNSFFNATEHYS